MTMSDGAGSDSGWMTVSVWATFSGAGGVSLRDIQDPAAASTQDQRCSLSFGGADREPMNESNQDCEGDGRT